MAVSLYVHIPFCKKKCYYCDFPSFCGKDYLREEYIELLRKEIRNKAEGFNIDTVFIGGGTPTFLDIKELSSLGKEIQGLRLTENYEFTVECNPGTLNEEKLIALKNMGVNRLSFGLQTTNNYLLKKIGRIHSYEQFLENYHLARALGFDNINVDLIFGLPMEDLPQWEEDLHRVAELNPEHISCYSLIIEKDTPFERLYNAGKLELPSEEVERDMYRSVIRILQEKGYHQYEISNFSKIDKECRHNLVYWELKDYIGCGTGAHSYLQGVRRKNTGTIEEYIKLMKEKASAAIEEHHNSKKDDIEEFIFMGMRKTRGISLEEFNKRFSLKIQELYKDVLIKYKNERLIDIKDNRLFFTPRGVEFSNHVLVDFLIDE